MVIHMGTRSASRSATTEAYSANRSAVSRSSQPPRSSRASGVSQWKSVGTGAIPEAHSSSTSRS